MLLLNLITATSASVLFKDITPFSSDLLGFTKFRSPISGQVYDELLAASQTNPFVLDGSDVRPLLVPNDVDGFVGLSSFDYDEDGYQDLYVVNAAGHSNSLFRNENGIYFTETFNHGLEATDQDTTGTCYGDLDNDGDVDVITLSHETGVEHIKYFENQGDQTWKDKSKYLKFESSYAGRMGSSCYIGDVNGDGMNDIFIAFAVSMRDSFGCFLGQPLGSQNALLINKNNHKFEEKTHESGLDIGQEYITWSAALVDLDLDGDLDVVEGNDQCALPSPVRSQFGNIFLNDGTGQFTHRPDLWVDTSTIQLSNSYMGMAIGDYNQDGRLDLFMGNFGNYQVNAKQEFNKFFIQQADGKFVNSPAHDIDMQGGVFAWSCSPGDLDNDGDTDILYHGGLWAGVEFVDMTNPGAVVVNNGTGYFSRGLNAYPTLDHGLRQVRGSVLVDFNNDGYVDSATLSASVVDANEVAIENIAGVGSSFDSHPGPRQIRALEVDTTTGTGVLKPLHIRPGDLRVELNDSPKHNNYVSFSLLGTKDLLENGKQSRDGVGATLRVTTSLGTQIIPGVPTQTHSQNSPIYTVGVGAATAWNLEVQWINGNVNKYAGLVNSQFVVLEIPCDTDAVCLQKSLKRLAKKKVAFNETSILQTYVQ